MRTGRQMFPTKDLERLLQIPTNPAASDGRSFHQNTSAKPDANPGIAEHWYCRHEVNLVNLGGADPGNYQHILCSEFMLRELGLA